MPVKFIHLQPGQSFVFEGQPYIKSSPLMGRNQATGKERLIPRSALVETEASAPALSAAPAHEPTRAEVEEAWRSLHSRLAAISGELERQGDVQTASILRREVAAAARDFEQRLGLKPED